MWNVSVNKVNDPKNIFKNFAKTVYNIILIKLIVGTYYLTKLCLLSFVGTDRKKKMDTWKFDFPNNFA